MVGRKKDPKIYGLLAEFTDPEDLLAAARKAHAEGFRQMDAYTPFPVHGLTEAVGFKRTRLPVIVLLGGLTGAVGGFAMQYYANVMHYPINIGGRPMNVRWYSMHHESRVETDVSGMPRSLRADLMYDVRVLVKTKIR